jgi:tetratricopeptide (TPR) repeat protein
MQPAELLSELRHLLSATDSPVVLPAIKTDPLVWSTLNQPELLYSLLGEDSSEIDAWSPAALGLRILGCRVPAASLRADPMSMIESGLRKRSLNALENMMRSGERPLTLGDACLIALALRERRRKTQTWDGFYNEITSLLVRAPASPSNVWDTSLACLYGLVPDDDKLIEALSPNNKLFPSASWISHIILAHPLTVEQQSDRLFEVLVRLPITVQVEWLRFLANQGRGTLVRSLAARLLLENRDLVDDLCECKAPQHSSWTELSNCLLQHEAVACLHQFAGHPVQAGMYLEKVRTGLHHWLVGSTLQMTSIAGQSGVIKDEIWDECEDIISVLPISERLHSELYFITANPNSTIFTRDYKGGSQPVLAQVFLGHKRAKNGYSREGQEIAREAIKYWLTQTSESDGGLKGEYVFDFQPWHLLEVLVDLGLLTEAIETAQAFLQVKNSDTRLLEWTADLCQKTGDLSHALDLIHQVILLEPEKVEPRRKLAEYLEDDGLWQAAIEERFQILEMVALPALEDRLALAKCAYGGGKYLEVNQVCKKILTLNPEHGLAHTYLGMALAKAGELEEGISYLSKATLLIPENALPWVELANVQMLKGESPRALETLRTAILNAPDSAELHFALGNACLLNGSASEALPFLRQSARLAPESSDVALALSETLLALGHEQEAIEVVEKARVSWPVHAGLAYQHARILIDNGDRDNGLCILEIALQCDSPKDEWFVLYARVLLGDPEHYILAGREVIDFQDVVKAQKALQKAMLINGHHFEARLMLAEVLALRQEYEAAFAAYHQIVDTSETDLPKWYWRIQAGFGKTALTLGQNETALAALQNAVNANTESINLCRLLTEAFVKVSLNESALQNAQTVLSMAPDDVENIIWFAEIMNLIEVYAKGIDALRTALQFEPHNIHLTLLLIDLLIKNGERQPATEEIKRAINFDDINREGLRRLADEAMRLEERGLALVALEKAVEGENEDSDRLLYELAYLYQSIGRDENALETIQKALAINPSPVGYYLLQSDLQEELNRPQAALASLERVVRITESQGMQDVSINQHDHHPLWITLPDSMGEIHIRFARLFNKMNNLNSALYHAEKAVEYYPSSAQVRYKAAEFALRLLQNERAAQLADLPGYESNGNCFTSFSCEEDAHWQAGLTGIQAFLALEDGDFSKAMMHVEQGLAHDPFHPIMLCSQIRILARQGDFNQAEEIFTQVFTHLIPNCDINHVGVESGRISLDISHLMLALAANEIFRWKTGLDLLGVYIRQFTEEPMGLLLYAREMVRAAEWQIAGKQIKMVARVYPDLLQSESCITRFQQLVSDFRKVSPSQQVERWKVRAEAIFMPNESHLRALASLPISDEDATWLVFGLTRIGNKQAALQICDQYPEVGLIQAMAARAMIEQYPANALEKARRATELNPLHPYCQVTLAEIAEINQEFSVASEAMEVAVRLFHDEAVWHLWAANLLEKCGEFEAALEHLERAYGLAPDHLEIVRTLGYFYLRFRQYENAVEVLSAMTNSGSKDGQIWFGLAEAYKGLENFSMALKTAEKAVETNEPPTKALVLCGEIALAMGDKTQALEFVHKAQKHAPEDADTRLLSARILISESREDEALLELTNALEAIPDALELNLERIKLVYKLEGASFAVELLQTLANDYPQDDRVMQLLAKVYMEVGKPKLAEKVAALSLRLNSYQPELHLMLGRIYQDSGQLDKAVFHLSEAVRIEPEEIDYLMELGKVYTTRREFPQALNAYQQAVQVAPEDYRPYYFSALVMRDGKDYPGAESMLRTAAQLAPDDINIRRTLGAIVALNLVQNCQEASSCQ